MSFWRQKKEELNDSSEKLDENREEVKSTEDVRQSSEEEQINKIIQQLHDEKHKNAELRQTIEQLQVKISSMDSKMKDMGEAADATSKDETPSEGQCSGQNEKSNEGQNEMPSESQSEAERPVVEEQEQAKPSEQQVAIMERINAIADLLDTRVKELIADRSNLVKQLCSILAYKPCVYFRGNQIYKFVSFDSLTLPQFTIVLRVGNFIP